MGQGEGIVIGTKRIPRAERRGQAKRQKGMDTPRDLASPRGQWRSKTGNSQRLSTSWNRPELRVSEPQLTPQPTSHLKSPDSHASPCLHAASVRARPPSSPGQGGGSDHLFPGPCASPPQVALLYEGNVTGMSLTKTRSGLETRWCGYFLGCPQLMPGRAVHSLLRGSVGQYSVRGARLGGWSRAC